MGDGVAALHNPMRYTTGMVFHTVSGSKWKNCPPENSVYVLNRVQLKMYKPGVEREEWQPCTTPCTTQPGRPSTLACNHAWLEDVELRILFYLCKLSVCVHVHVINTTSEGLKLLDLYYLHLNLKPMVL